jgi:hypothetical protein
MAALAGTVTYKRRKPQAQRAKAEVKGENK